MVESIAKGHEIRLGEGLVATAEGVRKKRHGSDRIVAWNRVVAVGQNDGSVGLAQIDENGDSRPLGGIAPVERNALVAGALVTVAQNLLTDRAD